MIVLSLILPILPEVAGRVELARKILKGVTALHSEE